MHRGSGWRRCTDMGWVIADSGVCMCSGGSGTAWGLSSDAGRWC